MEMDVRHYFEPVNFEVYSESNKPAWKYSMGESIEKVTNTFTIEKFAKLDLVIFGVPFDSTKSDSYTTQAPDKVRQQFYCLTKPQSKLNIVDFGNVKPSTSLKGNYKALRDIVEYLNELNIPSLVIGGSQDLSYGISEAYKSNKLFTYTTIDSVFDIKKGKESFNSKNYLSRIFSSNPDIFQFSLLAYQGHFVSPERIAKTKGINYHVRLGQIRDNILEAEPVLRNSDVLSFDIGAIKNSDIPGGNGMNPNGLRSEEACQLAKFAGLSERLKVFGIFEFDPEKDKYDLTAKLSAELLWYYIDGMVNRKSLSEFSSKEKLIVYQVDVKDVSKPLVFLKNEKTSQWWMQIRAFNNEKITLSCTEEEYRQACNNDIPEIWLRYVQKIDELLK